MADNQAADPLFGVGKLAAVAKRSEVIFAMGIMAILTVLILPMPKGLLDVCLAFSLMISFSLLSIYWLLSVATMSLISIAFFLAFLSSSFLSFISL